MRKTGTLCFFWYGEIDYMHFLVFFFSHPHKKWRGCENKSISPFILQYMTVVFFILIRGYRKSKFISVRESTIPETHLPVLSGMHKNISKYETSSRKPFTSIIRKQLLYDLCREHPKVLASDKMSTVSFRRHFVLCICMCEMFV